MFSTYSYTPFSSYKCNTFFLIKQQCYIKQAEIYSESFNPAYSQVCTCWYNTIFYVALIFMSCKTKKTLIAIRRTLGTCSQTWEEGKNNVSPMPAAPSSGRDMHLLEYIYECIILMFGKVT